MNSFEIAKNVRAVVLRSAGEVMAYSKSWGPEFCVSEISGLRKRLEDRSDWFKPINANDFSVEQLDELGFGRWSEELPIRLIPIWIFPFLSNEIEAQSISGKSVTSVSEMDNDHRFGCLAYGVLPKKEA